ncbi:MAG: translation initiation factor IF-3 [Sphaerochaetaceae bacterium]|nr:translation initiation factor IF-3 [Sphaerochaetaceae bacterium]
MAKQDELRVNRQIRAREVFLIDENNEKKGVMGFFDALALAEEAGLDLVEISPNANPSVCRIVDYGKFRYQREKRMKENKKVQAQNRVELHEIRMQPKIDVHDLEVKTKAIAEFLQANDKCKVTIRFHGRELAHTELGKVVLDRILEKLTEKEVTFVVDSQAAMEGRNMSMMLSPAKKKN